MFVGTVMLSFSIKIQTYNATAIVQLLLLISLPVLISCVSACILMYTGLKKNLSHPPIQKKMSVNQIILFFSMGGEYLGHERDEVTRD